MLWENAFIGQTDSRRKLCILQDISANEVDSMKKRELVDNKSLTNIDCALLAGSAMAVTQLQM